MGFILALSTLQMFESNEAVRGRLIGPKPWDRIDKNFWKPKCLARNCECCLGVLIHKVCIKSCIDCNEAGNDRKNAGSQGEPMIYDFPRIVTEGFTTPETVFSKIYFCENMCLVE